MNVTVRLHGALREHADGQDHLDVALADGASIEALLDTLQERWPAVERRIRDEAGAVRRHINLFVDGEHLRWRNSNALHDGAEVLVLPAVSGG